jgi:poly(hydroxyalkanoate) depolymerase family esterase
MRIRQRTLGMLTAGLVTAGMAAVGLAVATPASAASLTQVTNFGNNPGNDSMYVYVPNNAQAKPAIVVAMHPCGGSGPGFYQSSEFASLADRYGFIVIYPSSTDKIGCFDNFSDASKRRGGGTDAESIVSMVTYAEQHYNGDPNRVFATGSSSGAMMTDAIVALYPDVFKAGAAFMGVPFACFPNESDYLASNSVCANGNNNKTPQQWGDLVRAAYPGYTGTYPRMQLWHGTADTVVNYKNLQMEVDQWTNVHGISNTPTSTDTSHSGWTRQRYANSAGTTQVESITVAGAGHSLPAAGMAAEAIAFFGLDSGSTTPPTTEPTTQPTTEPTTPPASGACRIGYAANTWSSGLTANITITNTAASAVNGWTLAFTLPSGQSISSGWNATYSPSSGQVTAKSLSYNASIPAGGSISIGYQATHTGNTAAPTSFTLNGNACTTA